ncbi:MAG: hypothetical protein AB7O37_16555 [Vicinamibacteria bacterium]
MSEEQASGAEPPKAKIRSDWFLQYLVSRFAGPEGGFPVTLLVGGALISGKLISSRDYFDGLGDQIANAMASVGGAPVKLFTEVVEELDKRKETADPDDLSQFEFIHLRDARFLQSRQPLPSNYEGNLWRGKIEAVDGFILGELAGSLTAA